MANLNDVGIDLTENAADLRQGSRNVGNPDSKSDQPTRTGQTALDDGREYQQINVAAGKD